MRPALDQRRIAHLINLRAAGDPACLACASLMRHAPAWAHHTCIVAMHVDDAPRAQLLGLPTHHRIPPRATAPLSRSRQLDAIWRDVGTPDILVVWPGADVPPPARGIVTLPAERLDAGPWPVDAAAIEAHDRAAVRRAWEVPDDTHVLLSVGEPANTCNAWAASYLGAVLTLAEPPSWVVVPAGAAQVDRALRFAERHDHRWRVIIDDAPLPRLIAGADAALHLPSPSAPKGSRAAGLAWAAARAMPIVVQASPAIEARAPHLACARIVASGSHRVFAHALSQALLQHDADQRAALARALRTERNPGRFVARAHDHLAMLAGSTAQPLGAA